jgi:two-component system, cell cycle sensor histidine kinase and response regulator CckA
MTNQPDLPPPSQALPDSQDQVLVLVVDDDDMVRWSTARTLRRAGYDVLEAGGVEEALICMQEYGVRVRLVLSDVIMPKQSGYDLGRIVRGRWPETAVILISGYTPVAMDRHGIETDGFPLLRKPVTDLAATIAEMIGPAHTTT